MKCRKCQSELSSKQRCSCGSFFLPQTEKTSSSSLIKKIISKKSEKNISKKIFPGCYIECLPFPPIQLAKKNSISIGRGPKNDLILPSNDVSRKHAIIEWSNEFDAYTIIDCDSQNGIGINKETIEAHVLKDKDVISIGTNDIVYYEINTNFQKNITPSPLETISIKVNTEEMLTKFSDSLNGHLGILELSSVLQMIAGEEKTGCIQIEEDNDFCSVYFHNGSIVHCCIDDLEGVDAFYEIMTWRVGHFKFIPAKQSDKTSMNSDLQFLLMEAARRMDESNRS